ncbi:hypothetical protein [Lunatimonas sp.]|uniref:hypothetical protein n=1 Tax=Lunatimonas sp. TaxID=2060141 RepID=UPI00263A84AD|nr:hypothetical protein [Lunatimonas sp.]
MSIRVVLLSILFAACKESGKPSLTLKSSEEVLITPKVLMSTNPAHIRFVESDSGQYFFFINHISRNPQFIDFESGELVKEIIHHNDGPNSMRNRTGVGLLEGDSIWVTFSPSSIGCVNFSSEVIFKRVIDNSPIPLTNLASNFHQSLYRYQSKIFGMQPSFMSHHAMDKKDIRNHPLVYSYDVELDLFSGMMYIILMTIGIKGRRFQIFLGRGGRISYIFHLGIITKFRCLIWILNPSSTV